MRLDRDPAAKVIRQASEAQVLAASAVRHLRNAERLLKETALERRQAKCVHAWKHAFSIQPGGGRGFSTTWCRKCNFNPAEDAAQRRAAG